MAERGQGESMPSLWVFLFVMVSETRGAGLRGLPAHLHAGAGEPKAVGGEGFP